MFLRREKTETVKAIKKMKIEGKTWCDTIQRAIGVREDADKGG